MSLFCNYKKNRVKRVVLLAFTYASLLLQLACSDTSLNNPYPDSDRGKNILYSSFSERPKRLDPISSYSSNEYVFIGQIYEPVVQYHYLKRPYQLVPLTATSVPTPRYLDKDRQPLPQDAALASIAYSVYDISIQPGIRYQPHPAFARDDNGRYLYHQLTDDQLDDIYTLADFKKTDSRELLAADYVYQIKRLAHPRLHSPIYGVMADYIVGLKDYSATLKQAFKDIRAAKVRASEKSGNGNDIKDKDVFLDLREYDIAGVKTIDKYHYSITIKGKYPQFVYWLAMPFFAPMPVEAEQFYTQAGLVDKNITLNWYPIGTGPYMLTENDPNLRMVMQRNPNFHGEAYPSEGEAEDRANGLLMDAGKPMPFIDKVIYNLEKEVIPYWSKFLQGYYDASGISSDSFDQAIRFTGEGEATLTEEMEAKGITLITAVQTSISYIGFNMLDPVVGEKSERARKLRQAISIAVDFEEYITIFTNGRGIAAQGPIPAGIFGNKSGEAGINPVVYDWVNGAAKRKPIEAARKLLTEAGYPNGRDAITGKPLLLNFDTAMTGPEAKAYFDWLRKQFSKLNIQLVIRNTDYNRFQEKMLKGTSQIYRWGWNADYPDPENFMFMLHGPNKKVGTNGENASNYDNPAYNRLFEQMKAMENGPPRQLIIDKMLTILRDDAPWLWGYHPKGFSLQHAWYYNAKPNLMANNTLKYKRIDADLRDIKRAEWNSPEFAPVYYIVILLVLGLLPGVITYIRKEHHSAGVSVS
ncbi:MAG: ABC transporter substrate-binding protein [Gammaproteobacteria bacterium]|nr:MAG: ABC transporter substrate-binding protein [Gammaproteobacteria bacterium]